MLKIIKCGAEWCVPCKTLDKIMDEILPSYNTSVEYIKIDIEEDVDFAEENKIRSVPTTIFTKNNKEVFRFVGTKSGNEIKAIIDQYVKQIF